MTSEASGRPGWPGSISAYPFVGRGAELEKLRSLLPRAEGESHVALVVGEAGVGKSRLAREFAAETARDGTLVLYGACDAAVRAPYGPFVEALGQLLHVTDVEVLRAALGDSGELIRLIPDLPALIDGLPEPVTADPDTERLRLHMAVSDLLAGAGRRQPILLVIEDAHWADAPTLQLLRHLVRSTWGARVLLLATLRDTEADGSAELGETLADLRRSEKVVRIRLSGLSGVEVSDLLDGAAGDRAGGTSASADLRELAGAIHDLTDGNAFLVCELWRALAETGVVEVAGGSVRLTAPLSELGTPESVREVVSQRLSRLAPPTIELLELSAVAGREFELDAIRPAARLSEVELKAALEQALVYGMLEELAPPRLAFRFTHELVRRALYDRLTLLRRAELHLRVGEGLEAAGPASGRQLVDLARHFAAAAALGAAERAVDYNLRAAQVASAALAYVDAAEHLHAALAIGIESPSERAAALLDLGAACNRAGQVSEALAAFSEAAEIGRTLESPRLIAEAAIGYEESCWRPGFANGDAVILLEQTLEVVGDDPELRIALLAGLARALGFFGEPDRAAIVRERAVALAREHGDRGGLARVLVRSYWSRGSTPLEETLAMLGEARAIAIELDDAEIETEAMAWRVPTFVALRDLASARAEVVLLHTMAERTAQPFMNHVAEHYGSALALCAGNLTAAEQMASRSREWGELLTGRDASGTFGIQMFGIRREQGRLAELAPALRVLAGDADRAGPWRPGLVAVLVELGMHDEARRELSSLAAAGIEGSRASLWLATLTYLTDAAAALGDQRMAAILYPELEPFTGTNVMIGHLVACYGAADRYLGMLAATLGEAERAEEHFSRAIDLNREMEAPTWLAHTAYEHGRFLLGRDSDRAAARLAEAASLAERIGMAALLAKVRALGAGASTGELPSGLSPREAQILDLVARGLSNRQIGEELSISEHTAANHIRAILRKTGSSNRTEAASFAHRHGLASA
jgi:DNA-binding CsgD family transcriptional regulator/tetratricopeptide (TPR) repeat protein